MALEAIRKLFNIYPGEGLRASFFAVIALLSSFATFGGATLLDGQFLDHIGSTALPQTYCWTAVFLILMALVLMWGLKRFPPRLFFSIILAVIAPFYGLTAFATTLPLPAGAWIFFKMAADASILLVLTGLWTIIGEAYDLQDAKRLFGLFGAANILGAAIGSGWVSLGLAWVGVGGIAATFSVALLSAFLLSLCYRPQESGIEIGLDGDVGWRSMLKQVFSSQFTLYLLLFNVILGLLEVVCEFNYMDTLTSVLGGGSEVSGTITRFLGKSRGWIYVGDMVFGMFLYGRLIKRVGINNGSLLSVGYFLVCFVAGPPLHGLFIAILGLIAIEGIVPVLEDSNFSLLLNAVPNRVRTRFRVGVEYFVQPIGMLGGALLLTLFEENAKYLGLGLAAVGVAVAYCMRRRYPTAIYSNLKGQRIPFGMSAASYLKKLPRREVKKLPCKLLKEFADMGPEGQLMALECLLHLSGKAPSPQMIKALEHIKEGGVAQAIGFLKLSRFANHETLIQAISKWKKEAPSATHRGYALIFLSKQGYLFKEIAKEHLTSHHPALRGAAILTILMTPDDPRRKVAHSLLSRLLTSSEERELALGLHLLGALGGPRYAATLSRFLNHSSPTIAALTTRLIGNLPELDDAYSKRMIDVLIKSPVPRVRRACLDVLEEKVAANQVERLARAAARLCPLQKERAKVLIHQVGKDAVPVLTRMLLSHGCSHAERIFVGSVLSQFSRVAMDHVIEAEMEQASFFFYHFHTAQWKGGDLTLLYEILWQRYTESIDLAIHLLSPACHDPHLLCRSLRSGDEKRHSHAVETVEKLCPKKYVQRLLPLIDDRPVGDKLRLYVKQRGVTLTVAELLARFEKSDNPAERLAVQVIQHRQAQVPIEELQVVRA